jgi:hypothetical protein
VNVEERRDVLEAIAAGAPGVNAADRLRALEALNDLDRIASVHPDSREPHVERDPDRIERILELALLHVGPRLIEERAEARAQELLSAPHRDRPARRR